MNFEAEAIGKAEAKDCLEALTSLHVAFIKLSSYAVAGLKCTFDTTVVLVVMFII